MHLKCGIRENSGSIEMSKTKIRLRRAPRNVQWRGLFRETVGVDHSAKKSCSFFLVNNLILGLF